MKPAMFRRTFPATALCAILLFATGSAADPLANYRADDAAIKTQSTKAPPQAPKLGAAPTGTAIAFGDAIFLTANGGKFLSAERTGVVRTDTDTAEGRTVLTVLDKDGVDTKKAVTYGSEITLRNYQGKRFVGVQEGPDRGEFVYKLVKPRYFWDDAGSGARDDVSLSRPTLPRDGWVYLADMGWGHHSNFPYPGVIFRDNPEAFRLKGFKGRWGSDGSPMKHSISIALLECPGGYVPLGMVGFLDWGPDRDHSDVHKVRCINKRFVTNIHAWTDAAFGIWQDYGSHAQHDATFINVDVAMARPLFGGASLWTLQVTPTHSKPQDWGWHSNPFLNDTFVDTFSYYVDPKQLFARGNKVGPAHRFKLVNPDDPKSTAEITSYDTVALVSSYGKAVGYSDGKHTEFLFADDRTEKTPIRWQIIAKPKS